MKIFGLEITKVKKYNIPEGGEFEAFIEDCHTKCNNQLRGITNDKAKEYNSETLIFYFGLLIEKSIEYGMELQQSLDRNKKIQP